jgi:hypothetical protein
MGFQILKDDLPKVIQGQEVELMPPHQASPQEEI